MNFGHIYSNILREYRACEERQSRCYVQRNRESGKRIRYPQPQASLRLSYMYFCMYVCMYVTQNGLEDIDVSIWNKISVVVESKSSSKKVEYEGHKKHNNEKRRSILEEIVQILLPTSLWLTIGTIVFMFWTTEVFFYDILCLTISEVQLECILTKTTQAGGMGRASVW